LRVLRRAYPLAHDRPRGRDLLGPAAALALRPGRDDLRPGRRLGPPLVDRADLLLLLRLQAAQLPDPHADRRLRRLLQPAPGPAGRPGAVVLPHDPALDDLR